MTIKTKTINISTELHQKIKVHCAKNNLKINEFIENELTSVITSFSFEFDTEENRTKMEEEISNTIEDHYRRRAHNIWK